MANYNSKYTGAKIDEGVEKGLNSATMEKIVQEWTSNYIVYDDVKDFDVLIVHGYQQSVPQPNQASFIVTKENMSLQDDWTVCLNVGGGTSGDGYIRRVMMSLSDGKLYFFANAYYDNSNAFVVTNVYGLKIRG